jgi:hypothetical protein
MKYDNKWALGDVQGVPSKRCGGQAGASLLEVLIAVMISGAVFSAACETLARFGERFRVQHNVAGLRQESRIGIDVLSSELRLAGTGGVPGQPAFLKIGPTEIWFRANLSGFQTVVKEPAQPGQQDVAVEDGIGWPEGKQVLLCSIEQCVSNELARNGRSGSLTLVTPLSAALPAGSAIFVSNRVRYYVGRDSSGVARVMRDVDGGAGTLISGISDFRLQYFTKNGLPTADPALVALVRVSAQLQGSGGTVVQEVGIRL